MQHEEPGGLMTTSDLVVHLRMSRVTLWRKRRAGEFPKPCQMGGAPSQLRWRRSDIDDWIEKLPAHDPVRPPERKPQPRDFGRLL